MAQFEVKMVISSYLKIAEDEKKTADEKLAILIELFKEAKEDLGKQKG
ncbi:MAG: hypothetical protein FWF50_05845 [Defluviitaleaceae bacterium]|nr:hypothetical protein [Defluviitaleaceae bacterium]